MKIMKIKLSKSKSLIPLVLFLVLVVINLSGCLGNLKTNPSNQIKNNSTQTKSIEIKSNAWREVSRGYRVKGKIEDSAMQEGKLKSITLKVTENMNSKNNPNPVEYNFLGKPIKIYLVPSDNPFGGWEEGKYQLARLKKGQDIVITFSQHILPDGKVALAALPMWIYIAVNDGYEDLQGNKVNEADFQP